MHKLCLHNPCPQMGPNSVLGKPAVAPCAWLALLLTKAEDVELNPGPTTHTNKLTPVIWICGLCHKQINKQQSSIRCNHTHNTHWVHLKCILINKRQYKPDWRCTIYTPTQIGTTPGTNNTTAHHKQITTHSLTNNNQPKDKNIVLLQININGIRNKIEELKTLYTAPNQTSSQYMKLNSRRKLNTKNTPLHHHTHRLRAHAGRGLTHWSRTT